MAKADADVGRRSKTLLQPQGWLFSNPKNLSYDADFVVSPWRLFVGFVEPRTWR